MREAYLTGARESFRMRARIVAAQGPCSDHDEFADTVDEMIAELKRTRDLHSNVLDEWTKVLQDNDRLKAENKHLKSENERLKAGK